jgi:hypothetical protein
MRKVAIHLKEVHNVQTPTQTVMRYIAKTAKRA